MARSCSRKRLFRSFRVAEFGVELRGSRISESRPRGGSTQRFPVVPPHCLHRSGKLHGMSRRAHCGPSPGRRPGVRCGLGADARHAACIGSGQRVAVRRGEANKGVGMGGRGGGARVGCAHLAGDAPALGDRGDHLRGGAGHPQPGAERPADAPRRGRGPRGGLPALARAPDPGGGDPPWHHRALLVHPARGAGGGRALRLADPPRARDPAGAPRAPSGAPAGAASCSGG